MIFTQVVSIALGSLFSISELLPYITNGNSHGIIHFILSSLIKDKKIKNNLEQIIDNIVDDVVHDENTPLNSENHNNYNTESTNTESNTETSSESTSEETDDKLTKTFDDFSKQLDNILDSFTEYRGVSDKLHLGQLDTLDKLNNNLDNNIIKILNQFEKLNCNIDNKFNLLNNKVDLLNDNLNSKIETYNKTLSDKLNSNSENNKIITKLDDIYSELYKVNHSEWDDMLEMILEHLQDVQRKNLQIANDDELKFNTQNEKNDIIIKEIQDTHLLLSTKFYNVLNKINSQIESNDENIINHVDKLKKSILDEIDNINSKIESIKKKK